MTAPEVPHVRWVDNPVLRRPTMIAAFTGWNDAGDAASNGVRQMIEAWNAKPLAEIDPEEFTDFATVRPHVRLTPERTRLIVWPTVGLWSASTPGGDVILVLGPEPALRWRMFCEQLLSVTERFEVPFLVTLGALLADVPHSRPVRVIGTASDDEVVNRFDLQHSRYEGPTGIVGVLHDACASADILSASLWAAVPAYAAQIPSPAASMALLQRVAAMVGSPPPTAALIAEAEAYGQRVDALLDEDPDLRTYVDRLEIMHDEGALDDDLDDSDDLDVDDDDGDDEFGGAGDASAGGSRSDGSDRAVDAVNDDLVAEVEQFLREQGG